MTIIAKPVKAHVIGRCREVSERALTLAGPCAPQTLSTPPKKSYFLFFPQNRNAETAGFLYQQSTVCRILTRIEAKLLEGPVLMFGKKTGLYMVSMMRWCWFMPRELFAV